MSVSGMSSGPTGFLLFWIIVLFAGEKKLIRRKISDMENPDGPIALPHCPLREPHRPGLALRQEGAIL
jgi:hypothetical protein